MCVRYVWDKCFESVVIFIVVFIAAVNIVLFFVKFTPCELVEISINVSIFKYTILDLSYKN